jgi:hypothetical protein
MKNLMLILSFCCLIAACTPPEPPPSFIYMGINGNSDNSSKTVTQSPLRLEGNVLFAGSTGVEFFKDGQSLGVTTTGVSSNGIVTFTKEIPLTKADNGQFTFRAFAQNTAEASAAKYYTSKDISVTIALP